MKVPDNQLKLFLLDSNLASAKDVEEAEEKAKKENKTLGDVLVSAGKISEDEMSRLYAYILGIPFLSLEHEKIDQKVLSIIPEPIARSHNIVAYKLQGQNLEVAMLDPDDLETIDFIKKANKFKIKSRLTDQKSIKQALAQYQKSLGAEFGEIIDKEAKLITIKDKKGEDFSGEELKKLAEDLPIVKIVDTLLRHAILQRASDIHIEPMDTQVVARYRIDGILHDAMNLPKETASGIIARIKVLASLKLDEKRLPQDGRFKIESEENKVSLRVSILPVYNGEKVVMRILRENSKGYTLEGLGVAPDQIEKIQHAIRKPHGLFLVTGPTGSGKTTTLYTILDILNTPEVNISTVEDPIEYQMPRINQSQVKPEIGFSFANGLRSLLRQDPDIIMVGEIRDNETATLAINAALTGHLVLSTLHTNSSAGAIPRLIDMKVEPFLLSSTLNVIVAQRLVRKLSKGKEKYFLNKDQHENLSKEVDLDLILAYLKKWKIVPIEDTEKKPWGKIPFYSPKPDEDSSDGYSGRVGIHESLIITETIRAMVITNATSDEIEKQAKKEGMITMLEDGIVKAIQGITSIEEVLRVTRE